MGKFISDEEMNQLEGTAAPKKVISDDEMAQMEAGEQPSALEALGRGAGESVSIGFQDELSGLVGAGSGFVADVLGGNGLKGAGDTFSKDYRMFRDVQRKENSEASAAHPVASAIGNVGGSVPTGLLGGGSGLLGRLGVNAAQGAVAGLGNAEGDTGEQLKDTALGGAIGAGTGLAFEGLGAGVKKLLKKIEEVAPDKAREYLARALGASKKHFKNAKAEGKMDGALDMALQEDFGPFSKPEDLVNKMRARSGSAIGETIDSVGETPLNVLDYGGKIEQNFQPKYEDPMYKDLNKKFGNIVDSVNAQGPESNIAQMQEYKKRLAGKANFGNFNPTEEEKMARDVFHQLNEQFEGDIEAALKRAPGSTNPEPPVPPAPAPLRSELNTAGIRAAHANTAPIRPARPPPLKTVPPAPTANLRAASPGPVPASLSEMAETSVEGGKKFDAYMQAKKQYGAAETLKPLIDEQHARDRGNKVFGLGDKVLGGGALAASLANPALALPAIAVIGAKKVAEAKGPMAAAWSAKKIARLLQNNPNVGAKFQKALQQSSARGPTALSATHYILSLTDPEYRQAVQDDDESL